MKPLKGLTKEFQSVKKIKEMHLPQPGDYIDIHVHGGSSAPGIFILESLMAHEEKTPVDFPGVAYTYGVHPWFLNEHNIVQQVNSVKNNIGNPEILAIGKPVLTN